MSYSQFENAKQEVNDFTRLSEIQSLTYDVERLLTQLKKKNSSDTSFALKKCLDKKKQTLAVHIQKISDPERTKSRFNKLMGKLNTVLEKHDEALKYYKLAAKYDPQDYEAYTEGFDSWLFVIYRKIASSAQQMSTKDVQDIVNESDQFILPVWNNQQTPLPIRIRMLKLRARFLEAQGRQAEAAVDWKKIYTADPKNVESLFKIADFEFSRGRRAEAFGYYKKLSTLKPNNSLVLARLVELGFEKGDLATSLANAKKAYETNPNDPASATMYAKALAINSRLDEAKAVNSKVLNSHPKNSAAQQIQGSILELEGDSAHMARLISKALLHYREALRFHPNKITLRIKMARILYEHRLSLNFQPKNVSAQDMDEAVRLLKPASEEDYLMSDVAELMILAAAHSNTPQKAESVCTRYLKENGMLQTLDTVLACIDIYKFAKKTQLARNLAEKALVDPQFSGEVQKIIKAMDSL